jgi:cell division protein FtsZ
MNSLPSSPAPGAAPRALVVGVGQAGANLVTALAAPSPGGIALLAADTDALSVSRPANVRSLPLGPRGMRGLSAGGDPARGAAAAEEVIAPLREAFMGNQFVLLLGGLGGGTATGALPVMARSARDAGALVLAVVTQPFEFEGERRQAVAEAGLEELRRAADAVVVLPNDKLAALASAAPSLVDAFAGANAAIADGVRGVLRLLTSRGLPAIDFGTLAGALGGRHARSALVSVTATGSARGRDAVAALQASPLLDAGAALAGAQSVIVNVAGGPDLTLPEISGLTKELRKLCAKDALLLGASVDNALAGRIVVTVLATEHAGVGDDEPTEAAIEEPAEEPSAPAAPAPRSAPAPGPGFDSEFIHKPAPVRRRPSRVVPPAPELTPQAREQLIARHAPAAARGRRRSGPRMQQQPLALDVVSVSRFDKSQPTIRDGHDLDVPTFIRRGVVLN